MRQFQHVIATTSQANDSEDGSGSSSGSGGSSSGSGSSSGGSSGGSSGSNNGCGSSAHPHTISDICFVHLYLSDIQLFDEVNKEYCKYFNRNPPSR